MHPSQRITPRLPLTFDESETEMRMNLTDLVIQRLNFEKQTRVHDTQLRGFGILVSKTTKTFFAVTGKDRKLTTLGRYPATSLKTARQEAKRVQTTASTQSGSKGLPEALSAFEKAMTGRVKPATLTQYLLYLNTLTGFPSSYDEVQTALAKWQGKPWAQNYAYASFRNFFNWCIEHGYLEKNPLFRKRPPNKTRSRERVLSDDELARIWNATDDDTYGRILRLLILTGQRREEVRNLTPLNVTDVLTFHTKGDKTNILPITPMIQAELVLPFRFNNWSVAKARFDDTCGVDFRHHDLRRSFATGMARIGVSPYVIERLLGHSMGKIEATYQRYTWLKEKTEALLTWEAHIKTITLLGHNRATGGSNSGATGEDLEQARTEDKDDHIHSAHHSPGEGWEVPEEGTTHPEPSGMG